MFEFTIGEIGSGKSIVQAKKVIWAINRSVFIEKHYKKPVREIWCNFHLNSSLMEKYKGRLFYWNTPQEMIFKDYPINKVKRKDFDCFWDEMAVEIPSDKWKDTDPAIRHFFAQHRKRGIQIFGNTQDYMMLDINARRMATKVFETFKVIGTRDISSTLPDLKIIWGIIMIWELDRKCIRQDDLDRKHISALPKFLIFTKKLTSIYNTQEDINKHERNMLQHINFYCADPECANKDGTPKVVKVEHIKS